LTPFDPTFTFSQFYKITRGQTLLFIAQLRLLISGYCFLRCATLLLLLKGIAVVLHLCNRTGEILHLMQHSLSTIICDDSKCSDNCFSFKLVFICFPLCGWLVEESSFTLMFNLLNNGLMLLVTIEAKKANGLWYYPIPQLRFCWFFVSIIT